jgi:hypothetical protein
MVQRGIVEAIFNDRDTGTIRASCRGDSKNKTVPVRRATHLHPRGVRCPLNSILRELQERERAVLAYLHEAAEAPATVEHPDTS